MKIVNFIPRFLKSICMTIVIIITMSQQLLSQDISASVNVFPPYQMELEYYLNNYENFFLQLQNNTAQNREVYLGIRVQSDYGLDVRSEASYRPSDFFLVKKNQTVLFDEDDFEEVYGDLSYPDDFLISGASQEIEDMILLNRILPEGSYRVCISVYDWNTDALLTEDCSRWFAVEVGDVPVIISPQNHQELEEEAITLMSWDAPLNISMEYDLEYSLKIIDLSEYGIAGYDHESLFADPAVSPVFEIENLTETFYNYESGGNDPTLEEGKNYMIRVTVKESDGQIQFQNNGHSEIVYFKIKEEEKVVFSSLDVKLNLVTADGTAPFNSSTVQLDWSLTRGQKIANYESEIKLFDVTEIHSSLSGLSENNQLATLNNTISFLSKKETGLDSLIFSTEDKEHWKIGNVYAAHISCKKGELVMDDVLLFECTEMNNFEVKIKLAEADGMINTNQKAAAVEWEISPKVDIEKVYCDFSINAFDSSELDTTSLNKMRTSAAIDLVRKETKILNYDDYNFSDTTFATTSSRLWYSDVNRFYGLTVSCISSEYNFTVEDALYTNCYPDRFNIEGIVDSEDGNINKGDTEKLDWSIIDLRGSKHINESIDESKCDCEVKIHDLTSIGIEMDALLTLSEKHQIYNVKRNRNPVHTEQVTGKTFMMLNSDNEKWETGHDYAAILDCVHDDNYTDGIVFFKVEDDIVASIIDAENQERNYLVANRSAERIQIDLISENNLSEYNTSLKIYDITRHLHFKELFEEDQINEIGQLSLNSFYNETPTGVDTFEINTNTSGWVIGNEYLAYAKSTKGSEILEDVFIFKLKEADEATYDVAGGIFNNLKGTMAVNADFIYYDRAFQPDEEDKLPCTLKAYNVTGYETNLANLNEAEKVIELNKMFPVFSESDYKTTDVFVDLRLQGTSWEVGKFYGFHLVCESEEERVEDVLIVEAVDSLSTNADLAFLNPSENMAMLESSVESTLSFSWEINVPTDIDESEVKNGVLIYNLTAAGYSDSEATNITSWQQVLDDNRYHPEAMVYQKNYLEFGNNRELIISDTAFAMNQYYLISLTPDQIINTVMSEVVFEKETYGRVFTVDLLPARASLSFIYPFIHGEEVNTAEEEFNVLWHIETPDDYPDSTVTYAAAIYDLTEAGFTEAEVASIYTHEDLKNVEKNYTNYQIILHAGDTELKEPKMPVATDLLQRGHDYLAMVVATPLKEHLIEFEVGFNIKTFTYQNRGDITFINPAENNEVLNSYEDEIVIDWEVETPKGISDSIFTYAGGIRDLTVDGFTEEEIANIHTYDDYSNSSKSHSSGWVVAYGGETDLTESEMHINTDTLIRGHSYIVILAARPPTGMYFPFKEGYYTRVFKFEKLGKLTITNPLENNQVLNAPGDEILIDWEIETPDGYPEEEITYPGGIRNLTAEGFTEEEIANIHVYDDYTNHSKAHSAGWLVAYGGETDLTESQMIIDPDTLIVGNTYMAVILTRPPLDKHLEFEEGYNIRTFIYQDNAFLTFNNPTENHQDLASPNGEITIDWKIETPVDYPDATITYPASIIDLTAAGYSAAEIAGINSYDDFINVGKEYSEHYIVNHSGALELTETEMTVSNNSLTTGNTYLAIVTPTPTTEAPLEFSETKYIRVFTYQNIGSLTFTTPSESHQELEPSNGKITLEWEIATPSGYPDSAITYVAGIIDLTAAGYTEAEIASINSHDDFINVGIDDSAHYVVKYIEEEKLTTTKMSPASNLFTVGHTYIAVVVPEPAAGAPLNFVESFNVQVFTYQDVSADCTEDCYYTETISTKEIANVRSHSSYKIGNFEITDLNITDYGYGIATGTGIIEIDFLMGAKIEVEFTDVQINEEGRIFNGKVKAKENSTDFSIAQLNASLENDTEITSTTAETVHDYILNDNNVSAMLSGQEVSMPIGLDQSIKGYNFILGFTKMTFEPTKATANILASLYLPTMGENNYIALGASEVCMNDGGFASEYILHLADDLVISHDADWAFQIDGGTGNADSLRQNATYVEVDCEGIKGFAIRGKVDLPTDVVVQEDADGKILEDELVTAAFGFEIKRGDDADSLATETEGMHWIADVDFDPFQIKGLDGWGFEIDEAYLDMSDLTNPHNMTFPTTYDSTQVDDTWQGFYIKSAKIKTPSEFLNGTGRKSAEIHNLIIDPEVSLTMAVTNIIATNEGNMDGWGFSIDSLYLSVAEGSFESSGMHGKLGMPLMEEDAYLKYAAVISQNENDTMSYSFAIEHEGAMKLPMFIANTELQDDSYVKVNYNPADGELKLSTFIKGMIALDTENISEGLNINIPATVSLPATSFDLKYDTKNGFRDVNFGFTSSENNSTTTFLDINSPDDLMWASTETDMILNELASATGADAQNIMSGFPISILETGLSLQGDEVKLSITPQLALQGDEDGFSVSSKFNILSTLEENATGKKHFKLSGFEVECVNLDIDAGNIEMAGELCFYNEQDENGVGKKGVKGAVNAVIPGIQLGINQAAEFGTKVTDGNAEFGTEDNFAYFFLDGLFYLGGTGIPIPPGYFSVHGGGGMIAVNMKKSKTEEVSTEAIRGMREMTEEEVAGGNPSEVEVTTSGLEMEPHFGARGLGLTIIMAAAKQELVNMDLGIEATWQKGEGLQTISVIGDGYFFTPLMERSDPRLRSRNEKTIYLLGDNQIAFTGTKDVYMDFEIIKGGHADDLMIEGAGFHVQNFGGENDNGYWDIQLGTYDNPGKVKIAFDEDVDWMEDIKIEGTNYFMLGHNVPTTAPPYPQKILDLLNNGVTSDGDSEVETEEVAGNEAEKSEADIETVRSGLGVAFGKQFAATAKISKGIVYAELVTLTGMDFNITQDEARVCYVAKTGESQVAGTNGWYGNGQAYTSLEGAFGVEIKIMGKKQQVELFELGAVAGLRAGGFKPFWAEGRANLSYSVLGGTVSGAARFPIVLGQDKCTPTYDDPLASIDMIAEIYPEDGATNVNPYTDPIVTFNLPMDEIIYIPTTNEYEEQVVEKYKPYLENFTVEENGVGEWSPKEEDWNTKKTELSYRYADPFTPKSTGKRPQFNMNISVKAKKWNERSETWSDLYVDGTLWEETQTTSFKTGEHPDYFDDDYVTKTVPLNRQRYFLQDEVMGDEGGLYFQQNMDGFFPSSDADGTYKYYLRFKSPDVEDFDIDITNDVAGQTGIRNITFTIPELENSRMYALQVIQKNTLKNTSSNSATSNNLIEEYATADAENDTYSNYQINSQASTIDESKKVGRNEHLVYVFYFQTSAYNSLSEKLATANVQVSGGNIYLQSDEAFDEFDIFGATDGDGNIILPRVFLTDPFESDYHTQVADVQIRQPLIDYVSEMQGNNPMIFNNYRYSNLTNVMEIPSEDLNFDWTANTISFTLNGNVFDGFDEPLRNQELNRAWSSLGSLFGGDGEGLQTPDGMLPDGWDFDLGSTTGNETSSLSGLAIKYDIHQRAEDDAETLEEWATEMIDTYVPYPIVNSGGYHYENYFNNDYEDFLDWHTNLLNRGNVLLKKNVQANSGSSGIPSGNGNSSKGSSSSSSTLTNYQLEVSAEKAFSNYRLERGSEANFIFKMQ